jgi:heme oxygenase
VIIETLRVATKRAHQELDHMLFPHIQAIKTREQYIQMLTVFYGFMKPVQDNIDAYLNDELVSGYSGRRRPERILEDINALTEHTYDILFCQSLPGIANSAAAFGAYYVMEGSTLGGEIIGKKIAENLRLDNGEGLSFFGGYGQDNSCMWKSFLVSLEQNQANHSHLSLLIESARETFITFNNWIIKHYCGN